MTEESKQISFSGLSHSDLFRENWEHVRHVENERMAFTSIYFLIIAGILAFLSDKDINKPFPLLLIILMLVLSLIGAIISFRLKMDIRAHGEKLERIVQDSGLKEYFTFGAESGISTHFKLRDIFPVMYFAFLVAILLLLLGTAFGW
jgi:hypothetical protein